MWAQYHRITSAGGSVYDYVADATGVDSTCGKDSWHGSIWRVRAVRMFADCGAWKYV